MQLYTGTGPGSEIVELGVKRVPMNGIGCEITGIKTGRSPMAHDHF